MKPKKKKLWPIGLVAFATLLTATAQFLVKIGAPNLAPTLEGTILNFPLLGFFALYAVASVMLIIALKNGDLSVVYPVLATSYVWVALLSPALLGESITFFKSIGVATIVLGVSFIGFGGRQ